MTTCKQCKWWRRHDSDRKGRGECRRDTPRVMRSGKEVVAAWPTTNASDFCGRAAEREAAE